MTRGLPGRRLRIGVACVAVLGASACTRSVMLSPPRTDAGAAVDAGSSPDAAGSDAAGLDAAGLDGAGPDAGLPSGPCAEVSPVDILFVVDNSPTSAVLQSSLASALPAFVDELVAPPLGGDGAPLWLPIVDLQVGVVSVDMGTGGYPVSGCDEPELGDDGILQTDGAVAVPGCMATYPSFLAYRMEGDPATLAADLACVTRLGTDGCGFEQPLEAMLKALTPSTSPIAFHAGTVGHADRENAGFLRPDSMLGVVLLTDENDCSAFDPELFDETSSLYTGELPLRCFRHPGALHSIDRYVDGLRALRADRPDLLSIAVLAGVPPDLAAEYDATDFDAIFADPRMVEQLDPTMPSRLAPSCIVPGGLSANPPTRLVELARRLPGQSVVQSICLGQYVGQMQSIARLFGERACARRGDRPE